MSFLKKILALVSILALCAWLTPTSQAMETWTLRDDMMHYEGWEAFVERIDTLLPNISWEVLMRLEQRLHSISWQSEMDEASSMKLLYLWEQTRAALHRQAGSTEIPEGEKNRIEAEVLSAQKSFLLETEKNIGLFMKEISASIGSREIGDMSWSFYYDIPFFGALDMNFDMKEYIADTESLENVRLRGNFLISFTFASETISSSFDLDLIVRGDDVYMLIENLNIEGNEDILSGSREVIEILQALWKTKTYIHIGNTSGNVSYDFGNILSFTDITSQEWYKALDTQALLVPTGKIGDTYFLSAHAEMCHLWKTLMEVFDPFSGGKCSSRQLEDFRENMSDMLDVRYVQKASGGTFDFLLTGTVFSPWSWLTIQTRDSVFQSLSWDISDMWQQTFFSWSYKAKRDINFELSTNNSWGTTEVRGNIWLNDTGIESMNIDYDYSDDYTSADGNLSLTNGLLKGVLTWKDFNDETFECTLDGVVQSWNIKMDMNCAIGSPDDEIVFTGKLEIDMRDMKNNILIEFSSSQNEIEIIRFHLQNIATRKENVSIVIPTPKKYIPLEELIERIPVFENMFLLWASGGSWEDDYEIRYNEGDGYSETCFIYDSGESECYKNYDDGISETCYDYTVTTGEKYCSYSNDEYYYDGEEDIYYYYEWFSIDGKTGEITEY